MIKSNYNRNFILDPNRYVGRIGTLDMMPKKEGLYLIDLVNCQTYWDFFWRKRY